MMGLLTIIVALVTADTVWRVNRHVSRMEMARVFAMAMTQPRTPRTPPRQTRPKPRPPVRAQRPPRGGVNSTATTKTSISTDLGDWFDPSKDPLNQPPRPAPVVVQSNDPEPHDRTPAPQAPADEMMPPEILSLHQTEVSEVTRQTWTLLCLLMLECVALAGLSALLDMRRARRNLLIAVGLMFAGTALSVLAARIITYGLDYPALAKNPYLQAIAHGGGFPPLARRDYAHVVFRGSGYAAALLLFLILPRSRRYGRAIRKSLPSPSRLSFISSSAACGSIYILLAGGTLTLGLFGTFSAIPGWFVIRWVLIGWSIPALPLGLIVLGGGPHITWPPYVFAVVGLVLQFACWGLPFAALGPPAALKTLLVLIPLYLIALGRLRDRARRLRYPLPAGTSSKE